jgi:hypothetical protein
VSVCLSVCLSVGMGNESLFSCHRAFCVAISALSRKVRIAYCPAYSHYANSFAHKILTLLLLRYLYVHTITTYTHSHTHTHTHTYTHRLLASFRRVLLSAAAAQYYRCMKETAGILTCDVLRVCLVTAALEDGAMGALGGVRSAGVC